MPFPVDRPMRYAPGLLLTVVLALSSALTVPGQEGGAKLPVPEPLAVAKAEKLIRDLFMDDYARKEPAALGQLANKLRDQARETRDDAPARFVLYREAIDLAAKAGEAADALKTVDELAKEFAVEALKLKIATLEKAAAATTAVPANKALVETIFGVVTEAQAADDFDAAIRLHQIAEGAAQKAKAVALVTTVHARAVQIESLRKDYEASKAAAATLAKNPMDPLANLILGKYLCFAKGQWDKGLPLLAMSSDVKLKDLAKQDVAKPGAAASQVELGDGWMEVAALQPEPAKSNVQRRALELYQQALPGLTGLTKTRVQKRVDDLEKATTLAPQQQQPLPPKLTNSVGVQLVRIPAGKFLMGSPKTEPGRAEHEGPQHEVVISKAFYLGAYELTQGEYEKVVGINPSKKTTGPDLPVNFVNWDDAVDFCKKLSALEAEKRAGRSYRLPTEAEWEYACRAGTKTAHFFGDNSKLLGDYAWTGANVPKSAPAVGKKKPNAWGLYDMYGNLWEWCADWYSATSYKPGVVTDPQGPANGEFRVTRGASIGRNEVSYFRSAFRNATSPAERGDRVTFRVVMTIGK